MSKKILSLDLGITSIGYAILNEMDNDRYGLIDYGISMFDKATDKDGKSVLIPLQTITCYNYLMINII